jgi:hypothetical protein
LLWARHMITLGVRSLNVVLLVAVVILLAL